MENILCEENYFSQENQQIYTGSSQIKEFIDCPARAMAKLKGEWVEEKTTALLVGSYVDATMSNTLDVFKAQHPEILKKDGNLKAEYVQADYIIQRMERDKLFMKYISGDHQQIMIAYFDINTKEWSKEKNTNFQIPIKIKIDSYFPKKAIVDLKCVKDFKDIYNEKTKQKENFVDYWKYTLQGALYQKVVEVNTGNRLPFFIAAITKEKEPDLALLNIDQETLDIELQKLEEIYLPLVHNIKSGNIVTDSCGHCDYCRFNKQLTEIINYKDLGKEE